MPTALELAQRCLDLYEEKVKRLIEEHRMPTAHAVEAAAEQVRSSMKFKPHISVGFVGESQVGKSTLINATLGIRALPSGGIGPLTARATRVTYGAANAFTVTYHPQISLRQNRMAVERHLEREDQAPKPSRGTEGEEAVPEAPDAYERQAESLLLARVRALFKLHGGSGDPPQDIPPNLLIDCVRAAGGEKLSGERSALARYEGRIEEITRRMDTSETVQQGTGPAKAFLQELRLRAAGWMAPLVKELSVELNNSMLEGLSLVDLPGIGVVGDPAAGDAARFVRNSDGDAMVIVFRNSGVTHSVANLLEDTNVLTRMVFAGTSTKLPIRVMIVITGLDNVARERYHEQRQHADELDAPPDRNKIFADLAEEMRARVAEQVIVALKESKAFEDDQKNLKAARLAAIEQLAHSMQVFCVDAPDFLSIELNNSEEAFIKDPGVTRVPAFRQALVDLRRDADLQRERTLSEATDGLLKLLKEHLDAIRSMYREGSGAAAAQWDEFRSRLEATAAPLEQEMKSHQVATLVTLRRSLPEKIKGLCKDAHIRSHASLRRLGKEGAQMAYASLNAALKRDGIWDKRSINYPATLTRHFVDAIGAGWEPEVVEAVRKEMRDLATRHIRLVEKLCEVASTYDDRIVAESHIETQKKVLKQHAANCVAWTRERAESMSSHVYNELHGAVTEPFVVACAAAVNAGKHRGVGAKSRILEAFEESGTAAIQAAEIRAAQVLGQHYDTLVNELEANYIREHQNPVRSALESLTNEEIERARRSDAQKRRHVITSIDSLLSELGSF